MRCLIALILLTLISSCGNTEKEKRDLRLQLISQELFDIQHEYDRKDDIYEISGRLKNPLSCTINGMSFEIYIYKPLEAGVPDSLKKEEYTYEELSNALKGKLIDQQSAHHIQKIYKGKVNSFTIETDVHMNIPEEYISTIELNSVTANCFE